MENIKELIGRYPQESLALGVGVLMVFIFGVVFYRLHKKTYDKRMLRRAIKGLGGEFLRNVVLPDGLDGHVHIDFCIRLNDSLLVLNVQSYPGLLFGGERVDLWTQMYEKQSHKFENPLRYNRLCMEAVRELTDNIPIHGRVVFTSVGQFPKGKPEGVSMLEELMNDLAPLITNQPLQERVADSWKSLQSLLKPSAGAGWRLA